MISKHEVDTFIDKIPPAPAILKETLKFLSIGELVKAAKVAETDLALKTYLKSIVNKPIYGFKNEVSEISQIFGILGVSESRQTVYNYMITLLNPSIWNLFKLNNTSFYELQAKLSKRWSTILKYLNIKDNNIYDSIILLPSSIIICEALFSKYIEDVNLLRDTKALDYNTILNRLCGINLFDISKSIANKWEMPNIIPEIISASSGIQNSNNTKVNQLGKWMHLLFFYELSQPLFIEAGLNDFIDFQVDYIGDIYDDFAQLMEIE